MIMLAFDLLILAQCTDNTQRWQLGEFVLNY